LESINSERSLCRTSLDAHSHKEHESLHESPTLLSPSRHTCTPDIRNELRDRNALCTAECVKTLVLRSYLLAIISSICFNRRYFRKHLSLGLHAIAIAIAEVFFESINSGMSLFRHASMPSPTNNRGTPMRHLHFDCRSGIFALLIFVTLSGTEMLFAQVTVAPLMLFVDSRSGIGDLYITNNSASPQELSISFAFGYPDADSAGNATMEYNDTLAAKKYSLNPMVRAYPRSFLLGAKQEQTVRLQVRTNNAAKDAFYFTRVKISSNPKSADIERKLNDSISTRINFRFDQILPVFYRKGNISTGLTIHNVSTAFKDKKLTVVADVERTGTSPFLGSVKAELYSAANERVAVSETAAAIYFRLKNKLELDLTKAGMGKHRLVLTFETKRSDVAQEDLVQAPAVSKEVIVNVR
jgi:hypothetical protein